MRNHSLRTLLALLGLVAGLGTAAPVAAQSVATISSPVLADAPAGPPFAVSASFDDADQQRAYRRPGARPPSRTGVQIFGAVDVEHMLAVQSFGATLGTATLFGYGAGVDFVNLGGGDLFVRVALSELSKSGTRLDGSTFSNGLALTVKMVPVDLGVGWRFSHLTRGNQVTPYVGGGALLLHYSETTPSGDSTDNTIAWFPGFEGFAGVDLRLGASVFLAPEVDFRSVPKAIGQGGVSQIFGESNLGGVVFRVRVGVSFGGR
jgi:hypothetical protein